jgi:hypothetical protein
LSISRLIAISRRAETCIAFSSDKCMCRVSRDGKVKVGEGTAWIKRVGKIGSKP